jgi:hypothetical protein
MAEGTGLAERVAAAALASMRGVLQDAPIVPDVIIVSRQGAIIAHAA